MCGAAPAAKPPGEPRGGGLVDHDGSPRAGAPRACGRGGHVERARAAAGRAASRACARGAPSALARASSTPPASRGRHSTLRLAALGRRAGSAAPDSRRTRRGRARPRARAPRGRPALRAPAPGSRAGAEVGEPGRARDARRRSPSTPCTRVCGDARRGAQRRRAQRASSQQDPCAALPQRLRRGSDSKPPRSPRPAACGASLRRWRHAGCVAPTAHRRG